MIKASAISHPNIAFSKYWGMANEKLTLPETDSISMTLSRIFTHTTVGFSNKYSQDEVEIRNESGLSGNVIHQVDQRVVKQLDRLRKLANTQKKAKVVSINNFPADAGIASSASAFSALTVAGVAALKLRMSKKELSILTRLAGSGSATRSIHGGFVLWKKGESSTESYATQIYGAKHWDLVDIILVVSATRKRKTSLQGHQLATSSPLRRNRIEATTKNNTRLLAALKNKDLKLLGNTIENEMFLLHAVAMSSAPPLLYWSGDTVEIIHEVWELRKRGVECYITLDAGPNPHIITTSKHAKEIESHFASWSMVKKRYICPVGRGAFLTDNHLF